jgi:cardiolipin synthase
MYEADLGRADEIVLSRRHRARRSGVAPRGERARRALSGSAGRAAAGALTVGAAVGAALTNRRVLGPTEASLLATIGTILLLVAVIGALWPPLIAWPLALFAAWVAVVTLLRARRLRRSQGNPPRMET